MAPAESRTRAVEPRAPLEPAVLQRMRNLALLGSKPVAGPLRPH